MTPGGRANAREGRGTARSATTGRGRRGPRFPGPYRTAAATATTTNISTSAPAMIRFRVFGSTHRA